MKVGFVFECQPQGSDEQVYTYVAKKLCVKFEILPENISSLGDKKTVLQAIKLLESQFKIEEKHVELGFKNVVQNTGLLGRWQILNQKPFVVCDTAHNSHGLKIVLNL